MKKAFNAIVCLLFIAVVSARSQTTVIDFDDGTDGVSVYNHYESSDGVTFYNVVYLEGTTDITGQRFAGISPGQFVVVGESDSVFPTKAQPLVAVFDSPVTNVTIVGSDVGSAGAELDAYDQVVGGNLVASNMFIGPDYLGIQSYSNLTVSATSIRRVEMYQPAWNGNDGMVWSTMTFSPTPTPVQPIVSNGDFETPQIGQNSSAYFPSNSVWSCVSGGIISPPGGGWGAPQGILGSQIAFLQDAGASMSQLISLPTNGVYQISYADAGRPMNIFGPGGNTTYQILLDSNIIAQVSTYTGQPFTFEQFQFET